MDQQNVITIDGGGYGYGYGNGDGNGAPEQAHGVIA